MIDRIRQMMDLPCTITNDNILLHIGRTFLWFRVEMTLLGEDVAAEFVPVIRRLNNWLERVLKRMKRKLNNDEQ